MDKDDKNDIMIALGKVFFFVATVTVLIFTISFLFNNLNEINRHSTIQGQVQYVRTVIEPSFWGRYSKTDFVTIHLQAFQLESSLSGIVTKGENVKMNYFVDSHIVDSIEKVVSE